MTAKQLPNPPLRSSRPVDFLFNTNTKRLFTIIIAFSTSSSVAHYLAERASQDRDVPPPSREDVLCRKALLGAS